MANTARLAKQIPDPGPQSEGDEPCLLCIWVSMVYTKGRFRDHKASSNNPNVPKELSHQSSSEVSATHASHAAGAPMSQLAAAAAGVKPFSVIAGGAEQHCRAPRHASTQPGSPMQ